MERYLILLERSCIDSVGCLSSALSGDFQTLDAEEYLETLRKSADDTRTALTKYADAVRNSCAQKGNEDYRRFLCGYRECRKLLLGVTNIIGAAIYRHSSGSDLRATSEKLSRRVVLADGLQPRVRELFRHGDELLRN